MKTPISYFLLALTALSVATTITALKPVLDMYGEEVFTGSYYVLPYIYGNGGGVTLAGKADDIAACPKDVIQASSDCNKGSPVKFSNWKLKVAFVPQNTSLNIETVRGPGADICMRSTYWWVNVFSIEMKHLYLTVVPQSGSPQDSLNSFFQIEEANGKNSYKIKFCRGGFEGKPFCGYAGIVVDENGVQRLAITNGKPFLVQFKKSNVIETVLSKNM